VIISNDLLPYLSVLSLVVTIGLVAGGFSYAFRNGRQAQLTKFQKDTNDALQQRIEVLESKIADFEKENIIQRHIIEMITEALRKRGLLITIDGEMITIEDRKTGVRSQHHKRITATTASVTKKTEEGN
jgi:hypothetical protein